MAGLYPNTFRLKRAADGYKRSGDKMGVGVVTAPGQRVITGSDFGVGPNEVLFARMNGGVHGQQVPLNSADKGEWTGYSPYESYVDGAKYFEYGGKTWLSGRDVERISEDGRFLTRLRLLLAQNYDEFSISFRTVVPPTMKIPGAAAPGEMSTAAEKSNWKMTWVTDKDAPDVSGGSDWPDLCVPTMVSNGFYPSGNTVTPQEADGTNFYYRQYDLAGENLFYYYQSGDESAEGANDSQLEFIKLDTQGVLIRETNGDAFGWNAGLNKEQRTHHYGSFVFPGWAGNVSPNGWSDVAMLYRECRVTVGPGARARIMTHDQPTIAASTKFHIVPCDSWTDSEIRYTPTAEEDLPYHSVKLADSTLLENI